ncbi:RcnB family protein [Schlegelella sp. S2-27]|uniref:RcnB family protein n=1 Tax=Caldimonas mangrovi TaxID=2944811 RepID=A0ABT0YSQ0_9BURK|nr:anti-virulence regulator CigR family protein [Caldimonas mangrovi]MCM5681772.1 RcnB family protein [Caldimonas mangrovi]
MSPSPRPGRRTLIRGLTAALAVPGFPLWAKPPEDKGPDKGGNGAKGGPGKHEKKGGTKQAAGLGKPAGGPGSGGTLVTAGITVSSARHLAVEVGIRKGSYQSLPPGIRKNLARGKPLPPGIAKKMAPPALVARLPVHPGYEWRVVGTDLVLVAIATLIIADVLFDVF